MKRKYIIVFLIIAIICIIIFLAFTYKLSNSGNNINKSDDNDILNIKSYEAVLEVEVYSNKNTNKYVIQQKYYEPNIITQEVVEPENIKGMKTIFDGTNLILENKNLNLKTIYEGYNYIKGNAISLISFIEEYKNSGSLEMEETEEEKVIKIELEKSENKYERYKKLYINKKTNLPTKMEILDVNQNRTVYILYKEIKINKISKEEVLAN